MCVCNPEFSTIENATLFYGSTVALESPEEAVRQISSKDSHWLYFPGTSHSTFDLAIPLQGKFLTVGELGQVATYSEHARTEDNVFPGIMLFKIIDLRNPDSQLPVAFGDPVYLQISTGSGVKGFHNGGILAARVTKSPSMVTILETSAGDGVTHKRGPEVQNVGLPMPISACM